MMNDRDYPNNNESDGYKYGYSVDDYDQSSSNGADETDEEWFDESQNQGFGDNDDERNVARVSEDIERGHYDGKIEDIDGYSDTDRDSEEEYDEESEYDEYQRGSKSSFKQSQNDVYYHDEREGGSQEDCNFQIVPYDENRDAYEEESQLAICVKKLTAAVLVLSCLSICLIIGMVILFIMAVNGDDSSGNARSSFAAAPTPGEVSATPTPATTTSYYPAVSDTYIRNGTYADEYFGDENNLEVRNGFGDDNKAYALFEFDLSDVSSEVVVLDSSRFSLRLTHSESYSSLPSISYSLAKLPYDSTLEIEDMTWSRFPYKEDAISSTFFAIQDSDVEYIDVDITPLIVSSTSSRDRRGLALHHDSNIFLQLELSSFLSSGVLFRSREYSNGEAAPVIIHSFFSDNSGVPNPTSSPSGFTPSSGTGSEGDTSTPPTTSPESTSGQIPTMQPTTSTPPSPTSSPTGNGFRTIQPTFLQSSEVTLNATDYPTSSPSPTSTMQPSNTAAPSDAPTVLITCNDDPCGQRAFCAWRSGTQQVTCQCIDYTEVGFYEDCPEEVDGYTLCFEMSCSGEGAFCVEEFDHLNNPTNSYCGCRDGSVVADTEDCPPEDDVVV